MLGWHQVHMNLHDESVRNQLTSFSERLLNMRQCNVKVLRVFMTFSGYFVTSQITLRSM